MDARPDEALAPDVAADDPADEPGEGAVDDEVDWAAYYRYTAGRAPRALFERARAAWAGTGREPGRAIEIGFGDGTETAELLAAGWRVLAIDAQQAAADVLEARVPATDRPRLEIVVASAETVDLPAADLVYSGYSLPYLGPQRLAVLWPRVREALAPGGLIVVNLFGDRDENAGEADVAFLDRASVERLLAGLEVIELDEHEEDAGSFRGPKHWHLFDIVARRPGGPAR
ncbi:MAG: class I SAM-dependent methyltransferase [Chloroflexota bacterium]